MDLGIITSIFPCSFSSSNLLKLTAFAPMISGEYSFEVKILLHGLSFGTSTVLNSIGFDGLSVLSNQIQLSFSSSSTFSPSSDFSRSILSGSNTAPQTSVSCLNLVPK